MELWERARDNTALASPIFVGQVKLWGSFFIGRFLVGSVCRSELSGIFVSEKWPNCYICVTDGAVSFVIGLLSCFGRKGMRRLP